MFIALNEFLAVQNVAVLLKFHLCPHKPLSHSIKFQLLIISEVLTLVQNLSNACLKCLMKLYSHPFPATSWSRNCKRINLHELNMFHICPTSTQHLVAAPSILHERMTTGSIAWVGQAVGCQNHWQNEYFE